MVAALVATGVVVLSSGARPWVDAAGGAFVPQDIAQDVAAARLFASGVSPYGPVIREMHSRVVPVPVNETFPHFPHPPFSLLVSWFSAYVSFETAALIWFSFCLALVFMLAVLLVENLPLREGTSESRPRTTEVLFCFGLLLAWPPVLYNLEKGQWSILLAVLVALGWRALSRGRPRQAGSWLGLAGSVKVFPVLLGGYLLLRARRALVWFILIGVVTTAVPLFRIGFDAFPAFIKQSQSNMPYWESFPSVTLSLHGALARLFLGGQWARPLVYAPTLARVIDILATLSLLALAVHVAIRANRARKDDTETAMPFAAWCALLPVLNPQSLGHNGVLLALPLVLTLRALQADARTWPKVAWALALPLVSIPRQTLWRFAPPPIDPLEGIGLIALPMFGALALFAVAVTADVSRSRLERGRADGALVE
jgi:hypothetical protein